MYMVGGLCLCSQVPQLTWSENLTSELITISSCTGQLCQHFVSLDFHCQHYQMCTSSVLQRRNSYPLGRTWQTGEWCTSFLISSSSWKIFRYPVTQPPFQWLPANKALPGARCGVLGEATHSLSGEDFAMQNPP